MSGNDPFVRGENAKIRLYQQSGGAMKPVYTAVKNWKVSENATESNDGVCGENRDRLDKTTNFYEATMDIYVPDMEFFDRYMEAQDVMDAQGFPLKQTLGVQIQTPRGNFNYICQEAMVGPWDHSASGRADANMVSLKCRFRYYKRAPNF